ncbi:HAMP domain-containing sensor histidine kinase [Gammaproteobacteria bacterium]|nr:HAMP domain-containing sensor histidine kinase [Gammaproteobacteria bacterium]
MTAISPTSRIAFRYFSLVAASLLLLHFAVYQFTTDETEKYFTANLAARVLQIAQSQLDAGHRPEAGVLIIGTNIPEASVQTQVIFGPSAWPRPSYPWATIPTDRVIDLDPDNTHQQDGIIAMARTFVIDGDPQRGVALIDNSLYEQSEEQAEDSQTGLIGLSFGLLIFSLIVIRALASRLAKPLRELADTLSTRHADNHSPLPENRSSLELYQFVDTFNTYQARIGELIDRERAFNRYLSHELRTPLTVIRGATQLLASSQQPDLVLRQQQRLQRAVEEMIEFTDTLLGLSKLASEVAIAPWTPASADVERIIKDYAPPPKTRVIHWRIDHWDLPELTLPKAAFKILLGNLLKNSFAATEESEVVISGDSQGIEIGDRGHGLSGDDQQQPQGFGLGLLLVRDICHREGWVFSLDDREGGGCIARVDFAPDSNTERFLSI